jgi:hypothetical protein
MTEAEMWELIRRAREQGIPLNETQKQAIREYLKGKLSPDSIRDFEKDFIKPRPPGPPAPRPWYLRPINLARFGVYAALAYLLVAAAADSFVEPKEMGGGTGVCNVAAGSKRLFVNPSATGPNGALKKAMEELETNCANAGLNCAGSTCPTCGPDVAVQTVNIKCRIFWYTAEVTAICQCWCK